LVEERTLIDRIVDTVIWVVLGLLGLVCVLPVVHVIALSLSDRLSVSANAVTLWPIGIHLDNYRYLFRNSQFVNSLGVSAARLGLGVPTNLIVAVLTAYPLSLDHIRMPGRTAFKTALLFGMLFYGGLIPYYMALKSLGLIGNFLVLIIPGALNVFCTILVINYFRGLPVELIDAAMLDGASHWDILFRVFLPLSAPSLATVSLFMAVGHWNSWFDGLVFLDRAAQWPLQSLVYQQVTMRSLQASSTAGVTQKMRLLNATTEGLGVAMVVMATLPIMLVYPLLQRYFVSGLTLGAIKA
jgi:putative aldouronate transport system permease protein